MNIGILRIITCLLVLCCVGTISAEASGFGKIFPIVRAVKGVKKIEQKKEAKTAEEEINAKLQERFPEEMKAIAQERESNPDDAKNKTAGLIKRYQEETGVDLNSLKPKEKEGIIRSRLKRRLKQVEE